MLADIANLINAHAIANSQLRRPVWLMHPTTYMKLMGARNAVGSFYFRDEVLPYYAGDLAEARDAAANDFKYWELMRRASERGYRVFDYGRSKRGTGSFDFKKNWGFEAAPLYVPAGSG